MGVKQQVYVVIGFTDDTYILIHTTFEYMTCSNIILRSNFTLA